MPARPTVSVVIPCYNAAHTLELCLTALHTQTHPPDEVVVVDDASTDASVRIAERCGFRVVRQPCNSGVSSARNAGVRASRGQVVFFLDADVALAPEAIAEALTILERRPEIGLVQGTYDTAPLIDDGPVEWYRILHAVHWRRRLAGEVNTAVFALTAVRRAVLREVGGFDEARRDCEDVEYSIRLAGRCRMVLTGEVVGRHDDADRLVPLLREQWRRTVPLVPLALAARRRGVPPERAYPPLGVLAVAALLASLLLGLLGPAWLAVPAGCVGVFIAADPRLPLFVRRVRGVRFTGYFLLLHLLVHVVLVAGLAAGALGLLRARRPGPGRPSPPARLSVAPDHLSERA